MLTLLALVGATVSLGASVPLASVLRASDDAPVALQVTASPFRYVVSVDGQTWFSGGGVSVSVRNSTCTSSDGTCKLTGQPATVSGSDRVGRFNRTTLSWACAPHGDADAVTVETQFAVYTHRVAFDLVFPEGAKGIGIGPGGVDQLGSSFPIFDLAPAAVGEGATPELGYNLWAGGGVPSVRQDAASGTWPPAKQLELGYQRTSLGALAVFTSDSLRTAVLSPAAHFPTTVAVHELGKSLAFGVHGPVSSAPAGFSASAVIAVGDGVNSAMRDWGEYLLSRSGKPRGRWKSDFSLSHLGYTTDNGAYYYYNTEPGKNYEDTILDLHKYVTDEKIPIRWILYDSWFYLKANKSKSGMMDPAHGVMNWTDADPAIFPSGLRYMFDQTGWPVVAHNRAWSSNNVYATQNGGTYDFLEGYNPHIGEVIALPMEERFWHFLIGNAKLWGLINYQQDWMYTQQNMEPVTESATLGRQWQLQMDEALLEYGLNWGYGGTTMANWLESTEVYAATNGRATDDYHAGITTNWNIGVSSVFCWALDLIPAKDGFWTTAVQPGHAYKDNRTEPFSKLHLITAVLTRGPVSPADKIGLADRDLIMRSCTEDGRLLQPDRPATAIDAQFVKLAFGKGGPAGEVWATESTVADICYGTVLSVELEQPYDAPLGGLGLKCPTGEGHSYTAYSNANGSDAIGARVTVDGATPIRLPAQGTSEFTLVQLAPRLSNGYTVLGEVGKVLPMAEARVMGVVVTSEGVDVAIRGSSGEAVTFWFVSPDGSTFSASCTVTEELTATITVSGKSAACLG